VCGDTQLQDVLKSVSAKGRPRNVPHASVALFGKGPRHAIVQPQRETLHDRRFIVEVGQNVVRVENVQVVWKQADSRFLVFETLWTWFLTDLGEGRAPKDFRSWSLANLASELTARTKREYDDLESVRRMINRLQVDIETAIKKNSGLPIGRDDIIETCGTKGKSEQGYRINPFTVLVRPMDAILSE